MAATTSTNRSRQLGTMFVATGPAILAAAISLKAVGRVHSVSGILTRLLQAGSAEDKASEYQSGCRGVRLQYCILRHTKLFKILVHSAPGSAARLIIEALAEFGRR